MVKTSSLADRKLSDAFSRQFMIYSQGDSSEVKLRDTRRLITDDIFFDP